MNSFVQYFEQNSLLPIPDDELASLFSSVLEHMAFDQITNYVEHTRRFNKQPVYVTHETQVETVVYWYCLRDDLRAIPAFFQAGKQLGLASDRSNELLLNLADAYKYDTRHGDDIISLATTIFRDLVEKRQTLDMAAFQVFLRIAQEDGEITRALRIVKFCMNAGLSMSQSMDIVQRLYEAPGMIGYTLMGFYNEIDSLQANSVSSQLLYEALKAMIDLDVDPKAFTQFLHIAATKSNFSQTDVLTSFLQIAVERAKSGSEDRNVLNSAYDVIFPDGNANDLKKAPLEYFPEIPGNRLILGCLPYRLSKSLTDGLADLKTLMEEEYTQGIWVFDMESETWYSMGGSTQNSMNGVRHEFHSYDISVLSKSPMVIKTNPEKNEILIAPDRRSLTRPDLQKRLTGFLAAMPSGADIGMLSELRATSSTKVSVTGLIVSSQGITEFTIPDDPETTSRVSASMKDMKGAVITDLDQAAAVMEYGTKGKSIEFVRHLTFDLLKLLPTGFNITVHTFNSYTRLDHERPF